MRSNVVYAVIFLMLSVSFSALADISKSTFRANKWEASLRANFMESMDVEGEQGSTVAVDDDYGFGFTFGYHYNEHLLVNFSIDYNQPDYQALVVPEDLGEQEFMVDHTLDVTTAQFNFLYHVTKTKLAPYLQAGLGWTYLDSNIAIGPAYGGCWWDPWWGYVCQGFQDTYDDNVFSYNFGAGIRYEFAYGSFIRAGYQNNWLDLDNADKVDSGMFTLEFGSTF